MTNTHKFSLTTRASGFGWSGQVGEFGAPSGDPSSASARGPEGFTLVELAVVMVIVAIIIAILAPTLSPERWESDSAVQAVSMTMNASQRTAVLRQHDVHVTMQLTERQLLVHLDTNSDGVVDPGEASRVVELPEAIGFKNSGAPTLPQGSGPISFAVGSEDPVLTFHRNGSASDEGVIYLAATRGRGVPESTGTRAVTIERATGVVKCHSYRTGSWKLTC